MQHFWYFVRINFFIGRVDIVLEHMSNVLRSFGFNKYMLLDHKKLKLQKTYGTEDKLYQIDTTLPAVALHSAEA